MKKLFTIGSDPEVLLQKQNQFASAIGHFPGGKQNPHPLNTCHVQVDNVALEWNVKPASSIDEWLENVVMSRLEIERLAEQQGFSLAKSCFGEYNMDDLFRHPSSFEFGCEPDFNAWDGGKINWKDVDPYAPFRSAGGHVHIGLEMSSDERIKLIQTLDMFCVLPTLHLEDAGRRQLYGGAGCFRPKSYGVEFRTPSNWWIFSEKSILWMYAQVERAINDFKDVQITGDMVLAVPRIINEHDVIAAHEIAAAYGITY